MYGIDQIILLIYKILRYNLIYILKILNEPKTTILITTGATKKKLRMRKDFQIRVKFVV